MHAIQNAGQNAGQDASHSDLSSPRYGFDLVCATTQNSINATMKEFLAGFQAKEFTAIYIYDAATKKPVLTPLSDIVGQIGGDPFSIPSGADQTNAMVQKLFAAKFMFGFRAKMGLPTGIAPALMPDIVVLDKGDQAVSYQLYCAEFEVIQLKQDFGAYTFNSLAQPANAPWIFLFQVDLDMRDGDQTAFSKLPASVQQRVKNLDPNSMFGVQQLYLDLNTAGLQQMPKIEGLAPSSEAAVYLEQVFIGQYWDNLPPGGVVLGYSVKPQTPSNTSASIIPTDLNIEVSAYVDAQGNATQNYGLYTLDYLVMSQSRAMPPAVPFSWNWVEANQESDFHGVVAVRRNVFADYLATLANDIAASLCYDTNAHLWHNFEKFHMQFSFQGSAAPASYSVTPVGTAAAADGFTDLMTLSFAHDSSDSSESALHDSSIAATFNSSLTSSFASKGDILRVTFHAVVYFHFDEHGLGISVGNFSGNVIDYTYTVDFQLAVDPHGSLVVTPGTPVTTDTSQSLDVSGWDKFIGLASVADTVEDLSGKLKTAIENSTSGFAGQIAAMLNSAGAWVYPGGKTFSFKQVAFSTNQDLIVHVTYVDPT